MAICDDFPELFFDFPLSKKHEQQLLDSGLTEDVIVTREYWTADAETEGTRNMLRHYGLSSFIPALPGLFIPIYDQNVDPVSAILRLDNGEAGQRYKNPTKNERAITFDVHPQNAEYLKDTSVPLFVCEGVKKGDSLTSVDLCAIALLGVTMYTAKSKDGFVKALPAFDGIELKERDVTIIFDTDILRNKAVQKAADRLKTFFEGRGAFAHIKYLPKPPPGVKKQGVDDYIAMHLARGASREDIAAKIVALPTFAERDTTDEKLLAIMNEQLALIEEPAGRVIYLRGTDGYQIVKPYDLRPLFAELHAPENAEPVGWWLEQSDKRRYRKVVFSPGHDVEDCFNLWTGFPVEPARGDISAFWDFVRDIICAGDEARYAYLRKWMAHAVQRTSELPGVAILLHGVEGVGKGMFESYFRALFGRHYYHATALDDFLGKFTKHLANVVLVSANEAVWGGDKRQQGRLKSMITDARQSCEGKGENAFMVDNYKRFIFSSNEDHPVPISRSDRRFVVYEVSASRKGDAAYWKTLEGLRENGGVEALMYDLQHEDLSDFNPARDRPTGGLATYKDQTEGKSLPMWLRGCLMQAEIRRGAADHDCYTPWQGYVAKNVLLDSYIRFARPHNVGAEVFWSRMRDLGAIVPETKETKLRDLDGTRQRAVLLAPLADVRKSLALVMTEDETTYWEHAEEPPSPCSHESHKPKKPDDNGPF